MHGDPIGEADLYQFIDEDLEPREEEDEDDYDDDSLDDEDEDDGEGSELDLRSLFAPGEISDR